MNLLDRLRSRWLPLGILAAAVPAASASAAADRPPLACSDPVVLRTVAAGLHFGGSIPEGYRVTETGFENTATGEELRASVRSEAAEPIVVSIGESRIEFRGVRTTESLEDAWRCAADFTHVADDRTTRGSAEYRVIQSGLDFRVEGRFTVDGAEIRF